MNSNWIEDFFCCINEIDYVVLRNYEHFNQEDFLADHPDIDILCRDSSKIVDALSLTPRSKKEDKIHYVANIKGLIIPVDLRCVGDGYLDDEWQIDILNQRLPYGKFYIMDKTNYFYSLIYHAYLQKDSVSPDYIKKLDTLAQEIGVHYTESNAIQLLNAFMQEKGYKYTIPSYIGTIANFKEVDHSMIEHNIKKEIIRKLYKKKVKLIKRIRK